MFTFPCHPLQFGHHVPNFERYKSSNINNLGTSASRGGAGNSEVTWDPVLLKRIRDLNGLDLQLYNHGVALFEQRWAAVRAQLEHVQINGDKEQGDEREGARSVLQ